MAALAPGRPHPGVLGHVAGYERCNQTARAAPYAVDRASAYNPGADRRQLLFVQT